MGTNGNGSGSNVGAPIGNKHDENVVSGSNVGAGLLYPDELDLELSEDQIFALN